MLTFPTVSNCLEGFPLAIIAGDFSFSSPVSGFVASSSSLYMFECVFAVRFNLTNEIEK